ncbi:MAG: hypothetical protein HYZ46_07995 [Nitrosomonadales bacterium]|nr:hypothetical protein [Nitrosomonadales bacterium]
MPRLLFATVLLMLFLPAHAEQYYQFIAYSCDTENNALTISYSAVSYEGEYKPVAANNQWELSSLLETKKDHRGHSMVSKINKIERRCELRNSSYTITMAPAPGNLDLDGRCGGHMSARVEVLLGGIVLLPEYEFDPNGCKYSDKPITTNIIFEAGSTTPQFKTVLPDEFFQ